MKALHMFPPLTTGSKLLLAEETGIRSQFQVYGVHVPLQLSSNDQSTTYITRSMGHWEHGAGQLGYDVNRNTGLVTIVKVLKLNTGLVTTVTVTGIK